VPLLKLKTQKVEKAKDDKEVDVKKTQYRARPSLHSEIPNSDLKIGSHADDKISSSKKNNPRLKKVNQGSLIKLPLTFA